MISTAAWECTLDRIYGRWNEMKGKALASPHHMIRLYSKEILWVMFETWYRRQKFINCRQGCQLTCYIKKNCFHLVKWTMPVIYKDINLKVSQLLNGEPKVNCIYLFLLSIPPRTTWCIVVLQLWIAQYNYDTMKFGFINFTSVIKVSIYKTLLGFFLIAWKSV
jgi:hypothetical protein